MKTISIKLLFAFLLTGILVSCKKESEYTIEQKPVVGTFTYTTKSIVPITVDPVTQQPLAINVAMDGIGNFSDIGVINMGSTFKFDFITGQGTDFQNKYVGENPTDSFSSTGSSQMQTDGSFIVTETLGNGKGKFSKIKGGGTTVVYLNADRSAGIGNANWTVTY